MPTIYRSLAQAAVAASLTLTGCGGSTSAAASGNCGAPKILHQGMQVGRVRAFGDRCDDAGHGFTSATLSDAPGWTR